MIQCFQEFQDSGNYKISNRALNVYIKQYKFLYVFQEFFEDKNQKIFDNFKESNIIIINFFDENDADIYMISFKHTIIVIKRTDLFFLNPLFLQNTKCKICFLTSKGRDFFKSTLKTLNSEIEFTEENEFNNMKQEFKITNYKYHDIWLKISECIIKYLIKQSYLKLNFDRIDNFFKNSEKNPPKKNLNKNDFIHVKDIGVGSSSNTFLYFHLGREEFFVMKMFNHFDTENLNLIQREIKNYEKIMNHPFLPKFYGNDKENNFLVIEYIDGNILTKVKNLKNNEKVTIIFELMLIIEYCHRKKLILRDLKPDNIIIDKNKTVVLIDFNRTIKFSDKDNSISIDLNPIYAADELCYDINEDGYSCEYSYECDIYSLGKIIYFIMKEEIPKIENFRKKIFFGNEYSKIADIVTNCIKKDPKERPLIVDLIIDFYIAYHSDIKIQNLHKIFDMNEILKINDFWENPEKVTELSIENKIVTKNIKNAVQFYLLTADQNDPETQNKFGAFYMDNKFVKQDIKKAISYFELAAKKNYVKSLHNLGHFYESYDSNKSIKYYTRSANLGYPESQFNLSLILLDFNIQNEAIKYLKLASENNFLLANYVLGNIYNDSEFYDINKAIHYYTLAADNGHDLSQYNLGTIYIDKNDIEKGIKYLTLASDQNFCEAKIKLGFIYYEKKYGKQNINKSIQYWTQAANLGYENASKILEKFFFGIEIDKNNINGSIQNLINKAQKNDIDSCYKLGLIYSKNEYVKSDIQKAIYYFQKAADQGHLNSQYNLGIIYIDIKMPTTFDLNKGVKYIKSAADKNYISAITKLGIIYTSDEYGIKDVNKGIQYLTTAANKNDGEASMILGQIYFNGQIINFDFNKAVHYLSIAAEFNYLNAYLKLGLIYLKNKNIDKAIKYFKIAADKGDALSQNNLGNIYHDENNKSIYDINKSIYYYSQAANQGFVISQYNLGVIYMEESTFNINKSLHFFKMAAEQNHIDSILNLATIFIEGELVDRDINEAIYYFNKASYLHNHKQSQFNLGKIYYEGKLVTRDMNKAILYLTKAADQKLPEAQYLLGIIYYNVEFGKQDIYKSIEYLELASNQNFGEASFALGQIYYESKYVDFDINKSIHYFQTAIKQNINKAYFYLGLLHLGGKFIQQDFRKAFDCFLIAAKDNFSIAQFYVGMMYIHYKDIDNGIKYLQLAAKQNYLDAKFNLGYFYYFGLHVPKDIKRAISYFKDAAKHNHPQSQCQLGYIYCDKKSDIFNIEKGIHFYSLSANQNFAIAQYNLGCIYLRNKYINKAIYYLKLAAEKGLSEAQYKLGLILYNINHTDINTAIDYFKKASNQNNSDAQFFLGKIYFKINEINKGIEYYKKSSKNNNVEASFIVGFLFHEGKYLDRSFKNAIEFYNNASSFNHQFAKNNLAILYKYGFEDTPPNIHNSVVYLDEARKKHDFLAMYNLAHIYFYHSDEFENKSDDVIELLIQSTKAGFDPAKKLLCLALVKKYNSSSLSIKICLQKNNLSYLNTFIQELIRDIKLYDDLYNKFKDIDFLYDMNHTTVQTKHLLNQKRMKNNESLQKNLSEDFYNGFN